MMNDDRQNCAIDLTLCAIQANIVKNPPLHSILLYRGMRVREMVSIICYQKSFKTINFAANIYVYNAWLFKLFVCVQCEYRMNMTVLDGFFRLLCFICTFYSRIHRRWTWNDSMENFCIQIHTQFDVLYQAQLFYRCTIFMHCSTITATAATY